jgi:hypothetical protein
MTLDAFLFVWERYVEVSFFLLSFLIFFSWRDPTEIPSVAGIESSQSVSQAFCIHSLNTAFHNLAYLCMQNLSFVYLPSIYSPEKRSCLLSSIVVNHIPSHLHSQLNLTSPLPFPPSAQVKLHSSPLFFTFSPSQFPNPRHRLCHATLLAIPSNPP